MAAELSRSGPSLIGLTAPRWSRKELEAINPSKVSLYAHDTLLPIANRKLCRHIVASAPVTAIVLRNEASRSKRYDAPLGEFASKITTEALLNKQMRLLILAEGVGGARISATGAEQPPSSEWPLRALGGQQFSVSY